MNIWELSRWYRGKKNPPANVKDARGVGSVPSSGRLPGVANGNPYQYSCWENSMDKEPGRLQAMGSQRVGPDWAHIYIMKICEED